MKGNRLGRRCVICHALSHVIPVLFHAIGQIVCQKGFLSQLNSDQKRHFIMLSCVTDRSRFRFRDVDGFHNSSISYWISGLRSVVNRILRTVVSETLGFCCLSRWNGKPFMMVIKRAAFVVKFLTLWISTCCLTLPWQWFRFVTLELRNDKCYKI